MRDFTILVYRQLLEALLDAGYGFQRFDQFLKAPRSKVIILRHDIDARKEHALVFAAIQRDLGIKGSYYFRMVPQSFSVPVIRKVAEMGHEIGYHYEVMDTCKGEPEAAKALFERQLEQLRELAPIETICMHGSPLSKFDNRDLWNYFDYKDYGILGEPYFDLDFKRVFYLTDTGRRWDGHKVSIRDKVEDHFGLSFRNTWEIINSVQHELLPDQVMMNFHPERWTDDFWLWAVSKYKQQVKNVAKFAINKIRG